MNPFTERYKTLSNPDLLKIIDNAGDYQPFAVEAAKYELAGRELTDIELATAMAENVAQIQEKQVQIDKNKIFEDKVKTIGFSIADTLNPIQTDTPSPDKIITRISIVFGILFLLQAFNQFGLIASILSRSDAKWDFSLVLFFIPFMVLPAGTFLFWRRKKPGWVLLSVFLTYSAFSEVVLLIIKLKMYSSGVRIFDNIYPGSSLVSFLVRMFLFGGCLWLICKNNIREIYDIDKRTMFLIGGITIAVTAIMIFGSISKF
jgi:hypothetical protein